ncbi:MAG: 4-alpha-glucanotransferase [Actinomycetota bacterium]|nr:4-alpha-glucanotransferase [Actinomycetota bacterium]
MSEAARARRGDRPPPRDLRKLAQLYGVQTSFTDTEKRRRRASADALTAVLRSMGVAAGTAAEVKEALRERSAASWARPLEPVVVAWQGEANTFEVRLPARGRGPGAGVRGRIELEGGGGNVLLSEAASVNGVDAEGRVVEVPLPPLPLGYHRLFLDRPRASALVISAPMRCPTPDIRLWGMFLPLYALRTGRSWGTADFTDLSALLDWAGTLGASTVGTLPLLASFLDQEDPFEPSPYSPASRLFWNELYLDVEGIPDLEGSPEARELLSSPALRRRVRGLRAADIVDYRSSMAAKRGVLEALARSVFAEASGRRAAVEQLARSRPALADYARFRAAIAHFGAPWQEWPGPARGGKLASRHVPEDERRYHLYVQFLAEEQLARVAGANRGPGTGLYLDMPLGVHPSSYDTWRERDAFARDASGGAPPDSFFGGGQNWGFPPLHPERIREQEYRYPIASIRHLLRLAGVLRLDHVMGLHRLYWVPYGLDATQGVYVRYRAEEMYAILTLEAARASALVSGEDLGTVPPSVRAAMARHGVHRTHVLQLEAIDPEDVLPTPPRGSVASLNTHDMWPFASFWTAADIDEGESLGYPKAAARRAREGRAEIRRAMLAALREAGFLRRTRGVTTEEALHACLSFLAASPARLAVANLEDLWGEDRPHNHPGTWRERPNWRRKAALDFEAFRKLPGVVGTLSGMDRLRRGT